MSLNQEISLKMQLSSETGNIGPVISALESLGLLFDYSPGVLNTVIPLVLDELIRNAIIHGNRSIKSNSVIIELVLTADCIDILIKDQGTGFKAENFIHQDYSIDKFSGSGRGLQIVKSYVDSMIFSNNGSWVNVKIKAN